LEARSAKKKDAKGDERVGPLDPIGSRKKATKRLADTKHEGSFRGGKMTKSAKRAPSKETPPHGQRISGGKEKNISLWEIVTHKGRGGGEEAEESLSGKGKKISYLYPPPTAHRAL